MDLNSITNSLIDAYIEATGLGAQRRASLSADEFLKFRERAVYEMAFSGLSSVQPVQTPAISTTPAAESTPVPAKPEETQSSAASRRPVGQQQTRAVGRESGGAKPSERSAKDDMFTLLTGVPG